MVNKFGKWLKKYTKGKWDLRKLPNEQGLEDEINEDKELQEAFMDDVARDIEKGDVYAMVANKIMISKWTGIRKSQGSHFKVIEKKGRHYIIYYDIGKKKTSPPIEVVDSKIWKKLISENTQY